ncbi:MAG: GAF domain-containing protein, partial [Candidatus Promineifilaceae bacterium]
NLRLLAQTEQYRSEAEEATRRLTREGWESYIKDQMGQPEGYLYDQQQVTPLTGEENGHQSKEAGLVKDLTVRGESIGRLEVEGVSADDGEEASELIQAVSERLSAHIENLRLSSQTEAALLETERRAKELTVVNRIAQAISQELELEPMLDTILQELSHVLQLDAFIVALYYEETDLLEYPLIYDDGRRYQELGLRKASPDSLVIQTIHNQKSSLILRTPDEVAKRTQSSSAMVGDVSKVSASLMYMPLFNGRQSTGAVSVQSYQYDAYTADDLALLEGVANHIAVALENARLFKETHRRAEELSVVNEVAQVVSGHIEQQELLSTVYEQIQRIMPVDAFTVTAFDPAAQMIHYLLVMDEEKRFTESPTPLGEGAISRVLTEGKPILILRTQEELDELSKGHELFLVGNVQRFSASLLFVPLQIGTEIIGGMSVQSYRLNAYSEAEVELLVGIANHVAVALENARLFDETQTTLAETELLYNMGTRINRAVTMQDLVDVVGVPGMAPGAQSAGLFRFTLNENGEPSWMTLEASWVGEGNLVMPVGSRMHLSNMPLSAAELYTPNEPLLVGNVDEDDRIDEDARRLLQSLDTKAAAIISMQQLDTWIGTLVIRWSQPYQFSPQEQRLYNSLARQLSVAMSNQMLLTETQNRAAQLEKLTQIETALSQSDDEVSVLQALGPLLEKKQSVSLHYVIDEEHPTIAYTVAHWENGQIQLDDEMHYRPFEIRIHAGLPSGLEQSDKVTFISDVQSDDRVAEIAAKEAKKLGFRAVVVIPLRNAGRWHGFVSVKWPQAHEFSVDELSVWEQLREPLAALVATRRAYLAQQEALSETAVLHESGAQISVANSYDEVLTVIRKNTFLGEDVTNVSIMLFDQSWRRDRMPAYAKVLSFWSETPPEQAMMRFDFDHYPSAEKILQDAAQQPKIFYDVPNAPDLDDNLKRMLVKGFQADTFAIFPMVVRGEWIGYVNAMFPQRPSLTDKDIRRAEAIIRQAGVAVQGLRNLEQAEHQALVAQNRSSELASINRVVTTVVSLLDLEEMLDTVAGELIELFAVHHVGIALINPDETSLKVVADHSRNPEDESAVGLDIPLAGNELSQKVILTRQPAVVENAQTNPLTEPVHDVMRWRGTEVLVLLPLISGREVIGTLGMDIVEKDRTFSDAELQLATTIVAQISTAVQNVQLFGQTEARAQELAILNEMSQELTATQSVESVIDGFHRHVSRLMEVTDAMVALVDETQDELVFRGFGTNEDVPPHFRIPRGSGLSDYVIRTQQPLLLSKNVEDMVVELGLARIGRAPESWLGVPLMSGLKAIGMVAVQSFSKSGLYTERHRNLLLAVANQMAIAIESARLFEQAQARSEELTILNEMGRSLTALVDMDTILETVYRYTARMMDAGNFYVNFFDRKRNEIIFALDIRGKQVMRNTGSRKAAGGLTEHIILTKEPLLIPKNVGERIKELGLEAFGPVSASFLGVPMMVGSQVIGVIGLQSWETPNVYNEQHMRLLTSVAGQAAIAIENARLFDQIQYRARRERILREVTARVRGATDADSVMRTAVREVGRALGRRTIVYLNQNDPQEVEPAKEEAYVD